MKKKAMEMSFGLIFSIIAGAIILFITIYASVRLIGFQQNFGDTDAAYQIANYLNPFVNGITTGIGNKIIFKKETRINLGCQERTSLSPFLGRQTISFSQESGFLNKWSNPGQNISRYNKFIFANPVETGKELYIFSVPFFTGFKVDDLIMMSFSKYCFAASPEFVKNDLEALGLNNVNFTETLSQCKKNQITVCFGMSGCNISVIDTCGDTCAYKTGYITKNNKRIEFFDNLIYAGIFSSPENYECNIKRLSKKVSELASIYSGKLDVVSNKGCNSLIGNDLAEIKSISSSVNSSKDFLKILSTTEAMNKKNCAAECAIYPEEDC